MSADSSSQRVSWTKAINGDEHQRWARSRTLSNKAASRISRMLSAKPSEDSVDESCVGVLYKRSRFYKDWRERFVCLKGVRLELREKEKAELRSVRRVSEWLSPI